MWNSLHQEMYAELEFKEASNEKAEVKTKEIGGWVSVC